MDENKMEWREYARYAEMSVEELARDCEVDRVGNVGVSAPTADRQTQAAPVLESGIAT